MSERDKSERWASQLGAWLSGEKQRRLAAAYAASYSLPLWMMPIPDEMQRAEQVEQYFYRVEANPAQWSGLSLWRPALVAPIVEPETALVEGNDDCPRCGGRRTVLLDTVEHHGPCETADDLEPTLVPHMHQGTWDANGELVGQEWGHRATGRGVSAGHPTREGAIAAWRDEMRKRGMR